MSLCKTLEAVTVSDRHYFSSFRVYLKKKTVQNQALKSFSKGIRFITRSQRYWNEKNYWMTRRVKRTQCSWRLKRFRAQCHTTLLQRKRLLDYCNVIEFRPKIMWKRHKRPASNKRPLAQFKNLKAPQCPGRLIEWSFNDRSWSSRTISGVNSEKTRRTDYSFMLTTRRYFSLTVCRNELKKRSKCRSQQIQKQIRIDKL